MRKRITNNLALKILAFLIAAFLWLVVVNIDDPPLLELLRPIPRT